MSNIKKSHFAILGLLSWQPQSGYDIKKLVEVGLSHFWNENYGNIYPTLDGLVRDGLAVKEAGNTSGRRTRNVYRITQQGQQLFDDWLAQPADLPIVRNELLLKFFLSGRLPNKASLRIVQNYQVHQQVILEDYRRSAAILGRAIETGTYPQEVMMLLNNDTRPLNTKQKARQCKFVLLTLRHGIMAVEARLAWCQEVMQVLTE
ncbi:MAG: PadR family transcriptional regulator [Planctomycetales bacterium]|nr:PadR family transcriptional regulator [Planctomycetales bacterium]